MIGFLYNDLNNNLVINIRRNTVQFTYNFICAATIKNLKPKYEKNRCGR